MLDGGALPVAMDKYITVRYPQPPPSSDYFDAPASILLEEPASLREAERAAQFRRDEEFKSLLEDASLRRAGRSLRRAGWMLARQRTIPPSAPRTLPAACRT